MRKCLRQDRCCRRQAARNTAMKYAMYILADAGINLLTEYINGDIGDLITLRMG